LPFVGKINFTQLSKDFQTLKGLALMQNAGIIFATTLPVVDLVPKKNRGKPRCLDQPGWRISGNRLSI
jgi:hypothetical protein